MLQAPTFLLCVTILTVSRMVANQTIQHAMCEVSQMKEFAESQCARQGLVLPDFTSEKDRDDILHMTRNCSVRMVWLAITKHVGNWMWTVLNDPVSVVPLRGKAGNCAFIRDKRFYSADCFTHRDGYICEIGDCTSCMSPHCHYVDTRNGRICIWLVKEGTTWFQSSLSCERSGGRLINRVYQLPEIESLESQKEYWIGLSRAKWKTEAGNSVPYNTWSTESGSSDEKACAVFKDQRAIPADCTEKYPFLCINGTTTSRMPSTLGLKTALTISEATKMSFTRGDKVFPEYKLRIHLINFVALGCGVFLCGMIITGILWLCVARAQRRRTRQEESDAATLQSLGAALSLLGQEITQRNITGSRLHIPLGVSVNQNLSIMGRSHPTLPIIRQLPNLKTNNQQRLSSAWSSPDMGFNDYSPDPDYDVISGPDRAMPYPTGYMQMT